MRENAISRKKADKLVSYGNNFWENFLRKQMKILKTEKLATLAEEEEVPRK